VKHSTRERVLEDVARLSEARLELAPFIDEAERLLARAVAHDGACWHTMDPATLIETSFRTFDLPPLHERMADLEYLRDDYNKFNALARARRHSGVLSEATAGDLDRSTRYREVLRSACWGCFVIFRQAPGDFSAQERDFAHDLAPALASGVRAALVCNGPPSIAALLEPGLILLDAEQRVESFTVGARRWLAELGFTGEPARDRLPHALHAVAARVHGTDGDAISRVRTTSGRWMVLPGGDHPAERDTLVHRAADRCGLRIHQTGTRADRARPPGPRDRRHRLAALHLSAHRSGTPQIHFHQGRRT
jgi:hypothetical protein